MMENEVNTNATSNMRSSSTMLSTYIVQSGQLYVQQRESAHAHWQTTSGDMPSDSGARQTDPAKEPVIKLR